MSKYVAAVICRRCQRVLRGTNLEAESNRRCALINFRKYASALGWDTSREYESICPACREDPSPGGPPVIDGLRLE